MNKNEKMKNKKNGTIEKKDIVRSDMRKIGV
jgi:hypothetical protein